MTNLPARLRNEAQLVHGQRRDLLIEAAEALEAARALALGSAVIRCHQINLQIQESMSYVQTHSDEWRRLRERAEASANCAQKIDEMIKEVRS